MKVYVFGNQDEPLDNKALEITEKLKTAFPAIHFTFVKPNEDLPFEDADKVIILDTVSGITKPMLLDETDIEKLSVSSYTSVHDFDLGFQLKYLKKLGKLRRVTIVGIPLEKETDYFSIQSIFKKLVAQDIHGS